MADQTKDEGFKVTDRRSFNADGSPRDDSKSAKKAEGKPGLKEDTKTGRGPKPAASPRPVKSSLAEETHQSAEPVRHDAERTDASLGFDVQDAGPTKPDLPPPTFESFINMLGFEAAMDLGLMQNPIEGRVNIDLPAARHMIDTLAMLQEKTAGNLTPRESDMLETILANLQMQFVEVSRDK